MASELTDSLRETLACFDDSAAPRTTSEISQALELGRRSTYERLDRLVEHGELETKKVGASARVWWRPPGSSSADNSDRPDEQVVSELETLQVFSRDLLEATTSEEVGEAVVRTADTVLELPGLTVYQYDDQRNVLAPGPRSGEADFMRNELPTVSPGGGSITGSVYAAGETRHYDDVLEASRLQVDPGDTEMGSGLFVPMGEHGIVVAGSSDSEGFDDHTQRLVELLATNAVAAYDRIDRERTLEESRRRYRTLVDNVPNGTVALVDDRLRYVAVGGTTMDAVDATSEQLEGTSVREELPAELADELAPRYEAALEGESSSFERTIGERSYQFYVVPVHDDDGDVFAALGLSQDVTERTERERQIERQREQLAALDSLNDIVRDVTEAVIERSTREEIERTVCERVADAESYEFAWIGDVDVASQEVRLRTEAGVEGYLDDVTISADPDDERSEGPTGRALRTGEIQTTQDIRNDPRYEPWRDAAEEYGFRSSAAIPIVHEDSVYGVLNVYADRPRAFEGGEGRVISQLGEIVGHAIVAAERKQALMSDEVIELEFRIRDLFDALDLEDDLDGSAGGVVTLDHALSIGDEEYIVYGSATPDAVGQVRTLVEMLPHWSDVTFRTDGEASAFELRLSEPPVLSTVASLGGTVDRAVIEDGDYRMTLHLSPGVDVRTVIDTVQTTYPAAEMVARRQLTRSNEPGERVRQQITTALTDQQRAALQAAYHAGMFEWPRNATGEEVADSLEIASPTFHQHLRKAQQKVFEAILDDTT